MSSPVEQRSPFVRFVDAFLQEENIKWVLGLGVCILLGSSLRLVTSHWQEYTPVWKYVILLGYTVAVFALGELSYHRLGLRKTGTVLMALTVLLIPLSFLALHWVRPAADFRTFDWLHQAGLTALLAANLVWSAAAAQRIFRHFLRRTQPTFLVSYLTLCVAGAVVPGLPTAWAPILALALWAVFAAGTAKVNRHVFWLTEEHRLPRICGFFPIALLGAQFAAVFALGLASHLTPPWMGLLCVLVALPVLLTADAVARVFEQRTGGLVRPIPWSISGPLTAGIVLCAAGLVLALTGWPGSPVVVPAAVLAAVAMGIVAHRTGQTAFVWAMLFGVALAYQTCPVLFRGILLQLRDQATAAVHEPRLPFAFYGLTYCPLIAACTLFAALLRRRGEALFAKPLRLVATVLPWLLLGVSFTHPSAVLPVALVSCVTFVAQGLLFRERQCFVPAAIAFLAAAYGTTGFALRVWGWDVGVEAALLTWTVAAGLLFVPGALCDRWSRTLQWSGTKAAGSEAICQILSLLATIVAAGAWVALLSGRVMNGGSAPATVSAILISVLLASHALRWLKPGLGELTLTFATYAAQLHVLHQGWTFDGNVAALCGLLLGQWLLSYGLERVPQTRLARAFGLAATRVSACGLSVLFCLTAIQWIGTHFFHGSFPWGTSLLLLAWGLDAARRSGESGAAAVAWSAVFLFCGAAWTLAMGSATAAAWWLAIWTLTGLTLLLLRQSLYALWHLDVDTGEVFLLDEPEWTRCAFQRGMKTWLSPLAEMIPGLFLGVAVVSLAFLGWPQRFAGLLALLGLVAAQRCRLCESVPAIYWPLWNWQLLLAGAAALSGVQGPAFSLTPADLAACGLPLAALAAASAWAFEWPRLRRRIPDGEVLKVHQTLLVALTGTLLFAALTLHGGRLWPAADLGWAASAFAMLAATLFASAVRTQDRERVWWGEIVLLGAVGYFTLIGAIAPLSLQFSCVLLAAALLMWTIGRGTADSGRFAVLADPFQQTAFWLPLVLWPLAVLRHFDGPTVWTGANSLPLLCTAAFYFWRGMERRQVATVSLSALILNTACALLWSELHWTDPQLFLIPIGLSVLAITELLHREIPAEYHDPLRYVGSLAILVSPTFHIVQGSWLHILTLMLAAVAVALAAIGLRIRALLYTGTAFLLADLVALVARGSVDQPNLLWIVGVALGASIIALGAACENHRETLLARLRGLAAELELWK